jgi:tungstate transport system substrate-binding protein
MPHRRRFLSTFAALPLASLASPGFSQQRRPQKEYLKVGVATSLFDSGFAQHIRSAVAHNTGLAIEILPGPSGKVLDSLEAGEVDIAITHAADVELALEKQGLVHDRRFVAGNDFVIAGPVERRQRRPMGRRRPLHRRDPSA